MKSIALALAALVLAGCASPALAQQAPDSTPAQPAPASLTSQPLVPTFQVQRYEISGSTVLDQETVDHVMHDAIGASVSAPQIRRHPAFCRTRQYRPSRGGN
jgi:hemolysin activation/secretion protein